MRIYVYASNCEVMGVRGGKYSTEEYEIKKSERNKSCVVY